MCLGFFVGLGSRVERGRRGGISGRWGLPPRCPHSQFRGCVWHARWDDCSSAPHPACRRGKVCTAGLTFIEIELLFPLPRQDPPSNDESNNAKEYVFFPFFLHLFNAAWRRGWGGEPTRTTAAAAGHYHPR